MYLLEEENNLNMTNRLNNKLYKDNIININMKKQNITLYIKFNLFLGRVLDKITRRLQTPKKEKHKYHNCEFMCKTNKA